MLVGDTLEMMFLPLLSVVSTLGTAFGAVGASLASLASLLDVNEIREATSYINTLSEDEKSIIHAWLIFEGLCRLVYYVLVFLAVFLLGRRIIQAMIAGYREARTQSV